MILKENDGKLELWFDRDGRAYVAISSPPAFQLEYVLRYVGDNSFEVSSFDRLEPLDQMKIMRTLTQVREQCQDHS